MHITIIGIINTFGNVYVKLCQGSKRRNSLVSTSLFLMW